MADPLLARIEQRYDERYVVDTLVEALARTPADVPLGLNEIEPTDPRLAHYVRDVVRPMVEATRRGTGRGRRAEQPHLPHRIGPAVAQPPS